MRRAVRHVSRHFGAYACLGFFVGACERVVVAMLQDGPYYDLRDWVMTQYFVNYSEHGFARRAVIGTLLRPVTAALETPEHFVFWVMVAMSIAAFAAILWLTQRYLPHRETGGDVVCVLRCALAIGSLGVVQVARDLGRYDMVCFALLIAAAGWAGRGRFWAASALSVLAVLIHEAFVFYGAPLVLAFGWCAARDRATPVRALWRLSPMLVGIGVTSLAVWLYGDSPGAAAVPHGVGGKVWARGVLEFGTTLDRFDVLVVMLFWAAVLYIYFFVARPEAPGTAILAIAAVCPLLLNLVGIDHARWLTLGFYAVVVNLALQSQVLQRPWRDPPARVLWPGYLLCLPLGPIGVVNPFWWFL